MPHYLESDIRVLPKEPGVYELIVLDTLGRPRPLARVGAVDKNGVLYIGCTTRNLQDRLSGLRRMMFDGASRGHVAGRTYLASPPIQRIAHRSRIAFRFTPCANSRDRENELLRKYFCKYGEVPPLNGRAEFISAPKPLL